MGSLCMELIDFELRRHDQWVEELEQRRRQQTEPASTAAGTPGEGDKRRSLAEFERSARKFALLSRKQDQLLRVAFYLLLNVAEDTRWVGILWSILFYSETMSNGQTFYQNFQSFSRSQQ